MIHKGPSRPTGAGPASYIQKRKQPSLPLCTIYDYNPPSASSALHLSSRRPRHRRPSRHPSIRTGRRRRRALRRTGWRRIDQLGALEAGVLDGATQRLLHVASLAGEGDVDAARGGGAGGDAGFERLHVGHGEVAAFVVDAALDEVLVPGSGVDEDGRVVVWADGGGDGGGGGGGAAGGGLEGRGGLRGGGGDDLLVGYGGGGVDGWGGGGGSASCGGGSGGWLGAGGSC
ncbi:hypothetical protein BDZ85DRAFT_258393 [Elsinoe ampelina]|uniref:Uncharacterized protein n=1 Tax=Elsinoe ampelina TaxID=302913 RepID=A0A6A6GK04_9PEZI|nr:hypothetical protein BDZ85DRAFT_258393 [Elsinoe ampelina]